MSEKPDGGLTKLVLPFIHPQELSDVFTGLGEHEREYTPEPLLNALAAITYRVAESIDPGMIDQIHVKMKRHKAEVQEELGLLWFNKACSSNRLATCLQNQSPRKTEPLYMYVGGGWIDAFQSSSVGNVVCTAKSWWWAAVFSVAFFLASRCTNFEQSLTFEDIIVFESVDVPRNQEFTDLCGQLLKTLMETEDFKNCKGSSGEFGANMMTWLLSSPPYEEKERRSKKNRNSQNQKEDRTPGKKFKAK